jgi:N-acetylmuramoyl-L-alanine amidase
VVLRLAKKLKKYIDAKPGMRAVLTREKDVFIPLHKRVRIAHQKDADIFLSLHADAFPNPKARGGSVYILSTTGASSVMARILAKSENASLQDVKLKGRDADVAFVLSDLTRSANIRASRKLGQVILGEMGKNVHLHKKSVQSANFAVLKSIDMPSLLIETAFISNPGEARKLNSDRFQTQMARSIVSGLDRFVKRNATKPRWGEQLYVHYRVQKGDTLSEIAENYNISTYKLKKINNIQKADRLYVGKKLRIPVSEDVIASL